MSNDRPRAGSDAGASDSGSPSASEDLFQQVRAAAARVAALRAPSALLPYDVLVHSAFQELDSAHEELRVAEEHVHLQADAIARVHHALERERQKYRELFDSAPEPYVLTDLNGQIFESNRRAAALFNIERTFVSGKPLALFVGPEDRAHFRGMLALLKDTDHATFELHLLPRGNAEQIQVSASVSRAGGSNGEPIALRWLFRDFGPSKDLQRRLQDRVSLLERGAERTAYELAAMKTLLDHCLLREEAAKRHSERVVREQAELLTTLAHELLGPLSTAEDLTDYARAVEGALTLELAEIDVAELLSQVLEDCTPTAKLQRVQLRVEPPDRPVAVRIDARRLRKALSYLVEDALKAAPAGGQVHVSAAAQREHVDVVVMGSEGSKRTSNAAGVESAAHTRGLQLARRVLELHGGSLSVDGPQTGRFALVTVRLPLLDSETR